MPKKTLFNKVIYKGIMGAIVGIVAGLMLGLLIWGLEASVLFIKDAVARLNPTVSNLPLEILTMLGMSFGAIIGSVSGIWTTIIEEKRQKN